MASKGGVSEVAGLIVVVMMTSGDPLPHPKVKVICTHRSQVPPHGPSSMLHDCVEIQLVLVELISERY